MKEQRLYNIWYSMKSRCLKKGRSNYSYYGGRGIKICSSWVDNFDSFQKWALSSGYKDDLTLDRINSDGNYKPSNCRWATKMAQSNNRRDNRYITKKNNDITIRDFSIEQSIPIKKAQDLYDNHGNNYSKLVERVNIWKQKLQSIDLNYVNFLQETTLNYEGMS